jgi:hypothetical protein
MVACCCSRDFGLLTAVGIGRITAAALPVTAPLDSILACWLQGFCNGNDCQAFPIVIGEFGGYMRDCRSRCAKANPNCMALELNVRH